jgi:hypothetical protein
MSKNSTTAEKFNPLEPNLPEAIEFAFSLPTSRAHLCAIHPDKVGPGKIVGQSFNKTDSGKAAALRWLTKAHGGGYGIYFNCNDVKPLGTGRVKADEAEVETVHFLHVDVDPPQGTPADKLEVVRAQMLAKIKVASPSLIINSGNGYGAFFAIDPVAVTDENRDAIKARNIALAERLGGDDCENLDRVMRLPFTVNRPNAKKLKAGRVPVLADIVDDSRAYMAYNISQFKQADMSNEIADKPSTSSTAYERIGSPDIPETVDFSKLDDKLRTLITEGVTDDGDRSKAVYSVACNLRRNGWNDGDILCVLTNPTNGIADHIFDQKQRQPEEQASRVIEDMNRRGVEQEPDAAEEFADDLDGIVRDEPKRKLPAPLSLKELMYGNFPRTVYAIGDLVMQGLVNMLYGDGGMGKTTVAIQMAVGVAAGKPVFGRDTIKGPSLLVLAEDGPGETKVRVSGALKDLGVTDLNDVDCEVWALPGEDISIAKIDEQGKTVLLAFYFELEKKLAAKPGLFVVLDNLVDIAQMGEAARLPVNKFFKQVLGGLAVKYGATLLVLGHPSKAAMNDGSFYSGSTAYRAAVRNMLVIKAIKGSTYRSLERLKNNYADPKDGLTLGWSDGVFVTGDNVSMAAVEREKYVVTVRAIFSMIDKRLSVARTNQGGDQTPRTVAQAINGAGNTTVRVSDKEVAAIMRQAENEGDLKYVDAVGKTKAGYRRGDKITTDFQVGDEPDFADEVDDGSAGQVLN